MGGGTESADAEDTEAAEPTNPADFATDDSGAHIAVFERNGERLLLRVERRYGLTIVSVTVLPPQSASGQ